MRTTATIAVFVVVFSTLLSHGEADRPRLAKEEPAGQRERMTLGTLFLPKALPESGKTPLFLHFHGPGWIAEVAAARCNLAVLHMQLGSGSSVYGKPFQDSGRLKDLLAEAERKGGREFELIGLTGWSAGYGAVRAILNHPEYEQAVRWVVLMDGLHAGYTDAKSIRKSDLACYLTFANDAAAGRKRFLLTHTKIVPEGYASTTETTDALIAHAKAKRGAPVTEVGLPVETEASRGNFTVIGCKGTTAADHVDHLHVMPRLVELASVGYADAVVSDDVPHVYTPQIVPDPKKDGATPAAQVEALFAKLKGVLAAGRVEMDDLVRLNVYAASEDVVPLVDYAMRKHMAASRPALTLVVGEPVAEGVHVSCDALARGGQKVAGAILPAGPAYYISGQAERGKSLAESTRKTLISLDASLESIGRDRKHVVQVKAFLNPMKQIADVRKEIAAHFTEPAPPTVFVEWTLKDSIEIEYVVAGEAAKEKAGRAVDYFTPKGMTASPVYSRVARINYGKRIFTSGLTGSGKDGAAEVKDVFAKLEAILKRHGGDFQHLAKATYYVSNDDVSKQLNLLRPKYYDAKRPPAASKAPVKSTGRKGSGLVLDLIAAVP